jgi:hypothetical protein
MLLQLCRDALPLTTPSPSLSVTQKENPLISEGASIMRLLLLWLLLFALATTYA